MFAPNDTSLFLNDLTLMSHTRIGAQVTPASWRAFAEQSYVSCPAEGLRRLACTGAGAELFVFLGSDLSARLLGLVAKGESWELLGGRFFLPVLQKK